MTFSIAAWRPPPPDIESYDSGQDISRTHFEKCVKEKGLVGVVGKRERGWGKGERWCGSEGVTFEIDKKNYCNPLLYL